MKRVIGKAMVLLVLGAIVNVAVAWGCAIWPARSGSWSNEPNRYFLRQDFFDDDAFVTTGHHTNGCLELNQFRKPATAVFLDLDDAWPPSFFPSWSRVRPGMLVSLGNETWSSCGVDLYAERATGWPWLACRYWRLGRDDRQFGYDTIKRAGLLELPDSWTWRRSRTDLPYLPVWPGLAINTLFYAAILWLLFAAPGRVRRRRRIKHGLCPACAYPIGASEACTECGKHVPFTSRGMAREGVERMP